MEVLPMPAGAIELPADASWASVRAMAVAALRQVLSSRGTGLPLGPETAADDEGRLLSLNRFALQLSTNGITADQIAVDLSPWAQQESAPQLLLSALVDEENAVVAFGGVLTSQEFVALAGSAERDGAQLLLEVDAFQGGVERLLTLVQLLEPDAIPRLALAGELSAGRVVIAVSDWLQGRVDEALSALGAVLQPVAGQPDPQDWPLGNSGLFASGIASGILFPADRPRLAVGGLRSAAVASGLEGSMPLAVLAIPLGLTPDGRLVNGEEARQCIESFQLLLIPSTSQGAGDSLEALVLQLTGAITGDLLPDGIELTAQQGRLHQSASSAQSSALTLVFQGSEPIQVTLRTAAGEPLQLPLLQLPRQA
jgi:hypothetical protein